MGKVVRANNYSPLPRATDFYSITGKKLPKEPEHGVYIIKYSDGKAEKVLK